MKIIELEALRGFASFYIFLHHTFVKYTGCNEYFAKLFIFGQEVVILFFLLSGYVIGMSQIKNNYSFKIYFKHRFWRIYSIVIPALVISYFIYSYLNQNWSIDLQQLVLNLFMFQDKPELKPGVFVSPLFHNEPLWSLSYEWWFYMIFFVHFKLLKTIENKTFFYIISSFIISVIGILSYKLIYNQISLFLMYYYIWASGVSLYLIFSTANSKNNNISYLLFCYILLILLYGYLFVYSEQLSHYVDHPILELRHYIASFIWILALLFVIRYMKSSIKRNLLIKYSVNIFAKFAPISFAFYILHYPVMLLFDPIMINGYLKILIIFSVTTFLSYLLEILFFRKYILVKVFSK